MIADRAVVVHGFDEALAALRPGLPVALVSAEGAALFAGCLWWRAVVESARAACPATACSDWLDCADAPGRAMEALRSGCAGLILNPACPGFAAVAAACAAHGAILLGSRPPALDLSRSGAARHLQAWLAGGECSGFVTGGHRDRKPGLG
jgi:hypothetical protein